MKHLCTAVGGSVREYQKHLVVVICLSPAVAPAAGGETR
jgi:hypothetical protein